MFNWDDAKNPGETKVYAFDWSKSLASGDTIATSTAALLSGDTSGLTVIDGTQHTTTLSYVRVSGGTAGKTAAILGTITTANGETLTDVGRMSIVADNAPLVTAADLTTLAAVKAYAGVLNTNDDAMLQGLITSYSQWVRSWLNRDLLRTTYSVRLSGRGGVSVQLPQYPIRSIASLSVDGVAITAQPSWGAAGFYFDDTRLYLEGYCFSKGHGNVLVTFDAGFDTAPADIAQAVNELVGLRYALHDKQGWSSKTLAGETVSLVTKDMPDSVKTALRQYQRVAPL